MKINISLEKFIQVLDNFHSMDCIYLLYYIREGYYIKNIIKGNKKAGALYNTLIRKGLITETTNDISSYGKEVLKFIESENEDKPKEEIVKRELFEQWWQEYPPTTDLKCEGMRFEGGRTLRLSKEECRKKFENIIRGKEFTFEEMMKALKEKIEKVKRESVSRKQNQLAFFPNSLTYLNRGEYATYINKMRNDEKDDDRDNEEIGNPIDI